MALIISCVPISYMCFLTLLGHQQIHTIRYQNELDSALKDPDYDDDDDYDDG